MNIFCSRKILSFVMIGYLVPQLAVAQVESRPTVEANCSQDPAALQAAIDAAPIQGSIINISGVCNPVEITRDRITIDGRNDGSIVYSGSPAQTLSAIEVRQLELKNLVVDTAGLTRNGVFLEATSATVENISVLGGLLLAIDNSSLAVKGSLNTNDELVVALGSSLDAKTDSVLTVNGFFAVNGASFFVNNQFTNLSTMGVLEGASGTFAVGRLNQTGLVLLGGNSEVVISRGRIEGNILMRSGAVLSLSTSGSGEPFVHVGGLELQEGSKLIEESANLVTLADGLDGALNLRDGSHLQEDGNGTFSLNSAPITVDTLSSLRVRAEVIEPRQSLTVSGNSVVNLSGNVFSGRIRCATQGLALLTSAQQSSNICSRLRTRKAP